MVAKAALTKALELDDSLPDAHLAMAGFLELWEWDWLGVEKELKRTLELNPNSADAHVAYADYLHSMLREDQGRREMEVAQALDPKHDRLAGFAYSDRWSFERKREYLDTRAPNDGFSRGELAKEFQLARRYKEAVEQWAKCLEIYGYTDFAAILRRGSSKGDYKGALRRWMEAEEAASKHRYVPSFLLAFIYSNLGDKDKAFTWLERAHNEHHWCMSNLRDDPIWDPIRSDQRFIDLERRVGLPI
jgi:tetratricopeptide (TPR) repeat protein